MVAHAHSLAAHLDLDVDGARRVLERVGERLLDDPRASSPSSSGPSEWTLRPAARARSSSPGSVSRPVSEQIEQPRHLVERLAAGRPDAGEALRRRTCALAAAIRPAPAWTTITARWWATMSCSSRAIRARSCWTASRANASCSRSSFARAGGQRRDQPRAVAQPRARRGRARARGTRGTNESPATPKTARRATTTPRARQTGEAPAVNPGHEARTTAGRATAAPPRASHAPPRPGQAVTQAPPRQACADRGSRRMHGSRARGDALSAAATRLRRPAQLELEPLGP